MFSKTILILPNYEQSNQLRYLVKNEMGNWRSGSAADMPFLPDGCGRGMPALMWDKYKEDDAEFILAQAVRVEAGKNIFLLTTMAGKDVTNRDTSLTAILVTERSEISLSDLENTLQGAEAEAPSNPQLSEVLARINRLGSSADRQKIGKMLRNFQTHPQGKWFSSVPFIGVPKKYAPDNGQGGVDSFPLDRKTLLIGGIVIGLAAALALHSCQGKKKVGEIEKQAPSSQETVK